MLRYIRKELASLEARINLLRFSCRTMFGHPTSRFLLANIQEVRRFAPPIRRCYGHAHLSMCISCICPFPGPFINNGINYANYTPHGSERDPMVCAMNPISKVSSSETHHKTQLSPKYEGNPSSSLINGLSDTCRLWRESLVEDIARPPSF